MNRKLFLEALETRTVPSVGGFLVASAILHSTESYGDFVTAEYANLLHRAPDSAGFNFFQNQMIQGAAPEVIEAEFVTSTEYLGKHGGTATGWVTGLYQNLLGRTPNSAEVSFWTTAMARGVGAFTVALGFSTSVERDADVVTTFYHNLLGRAPDAIGLTDFVTLMRSGANRLEVESVIVGSTEYIVDHGNSSTGFINGAYHDLLQRAPSNNELIFWEDELSMI